MAAAEAASDAAAAEAEAEMAEYTSLEYRAREKLLENFFDALGTKRNREILNYLLENGPKRTGAILKFCGKSHEFHTPSGNELKWILQKLGDAALIKMNDKRELYSTAFAEMALAAIGVALDKVEVITSTS
jgi:hypothetical protein